MKNYCATCVCVYCVKKQKHLPLSLCKSCEHFKGVYLEKDLPNAELGVICETELGNVIDGKWIPTK